MKKEISTGRVDLFTPDEFGAITEGINKMIHGLGERQRIRDLFGVYLSPEVSRAILEGRVALQGEARQVSILFCDIRDFTRFSAEHSPRRGGEPAESILWADDGSHSRPGRHD